MRIFDRIRGVVQTEVHAAFPETLLNACAQRGLVLWGLEQEDACTLRFLIHERELDELTELASRAQAELEILSRTGGSQNRNFLVRRRWLLLSLFAALALLFWSNLHIWEIEVRGCEKLTQGEVRRALEDCGVTQGTYWPGLSSETIRGEMLLRLPSIAWMTVNVSGSRAVVWILEREEKPEIYQENDAADIVASQTGILRELTVLNGRPLVSKGGAVVKGETLVTGAMDSLSHPTRYVCAQARILADTWYEWTAVSPVPAEEKGDKPHVSRCYALKLGKNRLNLFLRSRKELDGYDKIVHEYNLGVKGLFALPVTLVREEYRFYQTDGANSETEEESGCHLEEMLAGQIDGEILQSKISITRKDDLVYTTLRAHCRENIAQTAKLVRP